MAPATTGDEKDVPKETPWVASICWQRSLGFLPGGVGHCGFVKMLADAGGTACDDSAPMIAAPGAMISGFAMPVSVGPALENQHGSPGTGSRCAGSSGRPPLASSTGTASPTLSPVTLPQLTLFMVQPTPMIDGLVAGRLMVDSRTP